ncbi:MAG: ribonuclease H-like domain-containing protein, partial [Haloarculaceae archaeon]
MRAENSFIPVRGVGEKTERKLWERGVRTWEDFDGTVPGPAPADRVERFIATARDRLSDGDAAYFREAFPTGCQWRLYENFREDACFLDIETTGLDQRRHDVTVVSCHRDGETTTLVRGRDLTPDRLASQLADASLLVTFNGKQFDVPFLVESFGLDVDLPHVDLRYPCRRLDLTGGLKPIERQVGIDRDRPDLSGRDAVRLWHEYERGDDGALETLVSYNRDDTANLRQLLDIVTERLHRRVFEPA